MNEKVVWKSAITMHGELFVMMALMSMKLP